MHINTTIHNQKETVINVCPDRDDTPESLYSRDYESACPVQVDKQGDTGAVSGGSMNCSYWVCHPGFVREFVQCQPNKTPPQTMKSAILGEDVQHDNPMDRCIYARWVPKSSMPYEGQTPEDDFSPKAGGK